ncbi:MAG: hypothetical protein F4X02_05625 [Chloroflexi bacterium]|nr:hypothetical protein [Chloroflexota bacterium]
MRPLKSYFICFTVRSGSTLLSQLLADTGIAGQPKERFYHNIAPENPRGDVIPDYRAYLKRVLAADTSPNGVFGSKVGGGYWNDFARRLRAIDGFADLPLMSALDRLFPDLRYLHLTRRNKARQAVSHWLAIQTGRWSSLDAVNSPEPRYDFAAIDHLLQEIIMREAVWAEHFSENGIRPFVITYEDFVERPAATVCAVLDYLEIERPAGFHAPAPRYQRISDARSEEWVQRFRRDKQRDFWTQFW